MQDLLEEARSIIQDLSQPTARLPAAAAPRLQIRDIEVLTRALAVQTRNLAGLATPEIGKRVTAIGLVVDMMLLKAG